MLNQKPRLISEDIITEKVIKEVQNTAQEEPQLIFEKNRGEVQNTAQLLKDSIDYKEKHTPKQPCFSDDTPKEVIKSKAPQSGKAIDEQIQKRLQIQKQLQNAVQAVYNNNKLYLRDNTIQCTTKNKDNIERISDDILVSDCKKYLGLTKTTKIQDDRKNFIIFYYNKLLVRQSIIWKAIDEYNQSVSNKMPENAMKYPNICKLLKDYYENRAILAHEANDMRALKINYRSKRNSFFGMCMIRYRNLADIQRNFIITVEKSVNKAMKELIKQQIAKIQRELESNQKLETSSHQQNLIVDDRNNNGNTSSENEYSENEYIDRLSKVSMDLKKIQENHQPTSLVEDLHSKDKKDSIVEEKRVSGTSKNKFEEYFPRNLNKLKPPQPYLDTSKVNILQTQHALPSDKAPIHSSDGDIDNKDNAKKSITNKTTLLYFPPNLNKSTSLTKSIQSALNLDASKVNILQTAHTLSSGEVDLAKHSQTQPGYKVYLGQYNCDSDTDKQSIINYTTLAQSPLHSGQFTFNISQTAHTLSSGEVDLAKHSHTQPGYKVDLKKHNSGSDTDNQDNAKRFDEAYISQTENKTEMQFEEMILVEPKTKVKVSFDEACSSIEEAKFEEAKNTNDSPPIGSPKAKDLPPIGSPKQAKSWLDLRNQQKDPYANPYHGSFN
jgi:hypothetical protein